MDNSSQAREGSPAATQLQKMEIDRLSRLPEIPNTPDEEDLSTGVLLSERIERLCKKYKMIDPFYPEKCLKPAAYELCVGSFFGKAGKTYPLKEGDVLAIEPFDVVVLQTLETINLPKFLIARWNIRVKWAYKGLLWVGAPQVDPGYRGFLSCPLYNLSNEVVKVDFGEPIATIDFVPTSSFISGQSKAYDWAGRSRIIFQDYVNETNRLESALYQLANSGTKEVLEKTNRFENALQEYEKTLQQQQRNVEQFNTSINTQIKEAQNGVELRTQSIQNRVDSYTTTTFTVLAVLIAVLGIVVTRSPEFPYFSAGVYVGAISLWFALRAFYWASLAPMASADTMTTRRRWLEIAVGIILFAVLATAQHYFSGGYQADLRRLETQNAQLQQTITNMQRQVDTLGQSITSDSPIRSRLDAIQTQLDALRPQR